MLLFQEEAVDLDGSSQIHNQQQIIYTNMTSVSYGAQPEYTEWSREAALSGFHHNHTYLGTGESSMIDSSAMNYGGSAIELHPYSYKSKMLKRLQKQQQVLKSDNMTGRANQSRDEQSLREAGIGLTLEEVVDSSADEFNELIRVNAFGADQIALLKDIRRRGKNKVAAQICRKRKLDSIDTLKEDVDELKTLKTKLVAEYNAIHDEIKDMTSKFDHLYKEAVGASNYETNDPIVVFINNLKKLNSEPIEAAPVSRDRKKTFNSINSSDVDSSNHSSINSSDFDDEEDELDDDDEIDETEDESSADEKQKQTINNQNNKKLKRN